MSSTLSGILENWNGFEPVRHSFGRSALGLKLSQETEGAKQEKTLGEILKEFKSEQFEIIDGLGDFHLKTSDRTIHFSGSSFNIGIAQLFFELIKEDIPPLSTSLYFYARASWLEGPNKAYQFFLIHGDKVIREQVSFFDSHRNGFDPRVLESFEGIEDSWSDDEHWRAANDMYFYKKFYTSTRTGQLMVLRPDEPRLYHYSRNQSPSADGIVGTDPTHQLKKPLWLIVVLLVGILFLLIAR